MGQIWTLRYLELTVKNLRTQCQAAIGYALLISDIFSSSLKSAKKPVKKKVGAVKKSPSTPRPPISKDRTFDCDQCDKKYRRFEDLQIHQRKHTGDNCIFSAIRWVSPL